MLHVLFLAGGGLLPRVYACFCKIKNSNKNFLRLKCDWWCSYFDTTDGYLRFIPTDGQTTVPFFPVVIWVKPKPISRQNKKLTQQHNWRKKTLQPTRSECIYLSVCLSISSVSQISIYACCDSAILCILAFWRQRLADSQKWLCKQIRRNGKNAHSVGLVQNLS